MAQLMVDMASNEPAIAIGKHLLRNGDSIRCPAAQQMCTKRDAAQLQCNVRSAAQLQRKARVAAQLHCKKKPAAHHVSKIAQPSPQSIAATEVGTDSNNAECHQATRPREVCPYPGRKDTPLKAVTVTPCNTLMMHSAHHFAFASTA